MKKFKEKTYKIYYNYTESSGEKFFGGKDYHTTRGMELISANSPEGAIKKFHYIPFSYEYQIADIEEL